MDHHHQPPRVPSTGLRFRLYLAGRLVDEAWVFDDTTAEAAARAQGGICARAITRGVRYLVEVYDPDAPPEVAHVRFGDDVAGMGRPLTGDAQ